MKVQVTHSIFFLFLKMFQICSIVVILCLQMWKGAEVKKTKRLTYEEVKKQLIESMVVNNVVETNELNKKAEEVQDPEETVEVMQECEGII